MRSVSLDFGLFLLACGKGGVEVTGLLRGELVLASVKPVVNYISKCSMVVVVHSSRSSSHVLADVRTHTKSEWKLLSVLPGTDITFAVPYL